MRLNTTARSGARGIGRCCQYSTTSTLQQAQGSHNDLHAPPPRAGYARLTNRGIISITGVDSTTFLQGLVTQNMLVTNDPHRSTRRTGCYTAFLNSQGRMLHDAFLYPLLPASGHGHESNTDTNAHEPGWLIEVDKDEIPRLMKHLKKHKLRAKLKLRALDEGERTVWSMWKDHSEPRWAAYNLEPPDSMISSPFGPPSSVVGCIDTRAPGFGSRLVVPGAEDLRTYLSVAAEKEAGREGGDDGDAAQQAVTGSEVALETYTVRRMLHGIAEGQAEIIYESALPLECNLDIMRGVDFRKGCYVGQELTIRTHHTGVVRKRILPVQLYTSDDGQPSALTGADSPVYDPMARFALPPRGANISKLSARKGRSAGKFLGGVGNIGLALCRLEMMTDVALTGEGSSFTPDQEFKVAWDGTEDGTQVPGGSGEVKIRAIVPPWTKEFISAGGARKHASKPDSAEGHRARDLVEQLEEEVAQRRNE